MRANERGRGQIISKGDRKWLVRVYVGRDGAGKRKYHSETVDGTFKQAESKKTELLRGLDTQTFVQPSKQTVATYLTAWLTSKVNVSTATQINYQQWVDKHIIPSVGAIRLDQLTPIRVRLFYASLLSERKLAASSIRICHTVFNQALGTAVRDGLLAKNPCEHIELPQVKRSQEDNYLTPEQMRVVIEGTRGTPFGPLWRLLLTTGLRPQEVFAVTWDDLVEVDGQPALRITKAVERESKRGNFTVGETKTDGSRRQVALSKETTQALLEHKRSDASRILKLGAAYTRNNFMFSTNTGKFLDHNTVRLMWKRELLRLGLPSRQLYATRHTHATHLLSSGMNAKAVADRGGWSNANVLLNTYAHVLPAVRQDAADVVERMMMQQAPHNNTKEA